MLFACRFVELALGTDRCDGRLEVLKRQFELLRITLLGLLAAGGLSERGNQLFQALIAFTLALAARLCGDQLCLQGGNIVRDDRRRTAWSRSTRSAL